MLKAPVKPKPQKTGVAPSASRSDCVKTEPKHEVFLQRVTFPTRGQSCEILAKIESKNPAWRQSLGWAYRLVGRVKISSMDGEKLLFRKAREAFAVVHPNGAIEHIPHDVAKGLEESLHERRKGRHGGLGRTQGRLTVDGVAYPKPTTIRLREVDFARLMQLDPHRRGNMSGAIRYLADLISSLQKQPQGSELLREGLRLLAARSRSKTLGSKAPGSPMKNFMAGVDVNSRKTLRDFGSASIGRGVRRALDMVLPTDGTDPIINLRRLEITPKIPQQRNSANNIQVGPSGAQNTPSNQEERAPQ